MRGTHPRRAVATAGIAGSDSCSGTGSPTRSARRTPTPARSCCAPPATATCLMRPRSHCSPAPSGWRPCSSPASRGGRAGLVRVRRRHAGRGAVGHVRRDGSRRAACVGSLPPRPHPRASARDRPRGAGRRGCRRRVRAAGDRPRSGGRRGAGRPHHAHRCASGGDRPDRSVRRSAPSRDPGGREPGSSLPPLSLIVPNATPITPSAGDVARMRLREGISGRSTTCVVPSSRAPGSARPSPA